MQNVRVTFVAASLLVAILAAAPAAPPGVRVVLLGTAGGPTPKRARAAPAAALEVGGALYVIDCGNGVARQLRLAGLPLSRLRHVFVTHLHSDHDADLVTLPRLAWSSGLEEVVTVHGPPPIARAFKAGLRAGDEDAAVREASEGLRPLRDLVRVHEIRSEGVVLRDGPVTVTAARVAHPPFRDAFAYRFDAAGWSVVFSGDTAPSESLVRLAKGADVLVHEVLLLRPEEVAAAFHRPEGDPLVRHLLDSHTPYTEVGKVAAAAGVRTLVLTHFVPGDMKPDRDAILAEIRKTFSGEVVFGEDLMEIRPQKVSEPPPVAPLSPGT